MQLIHNAKGIYHDLSEGRHRGLFLGNRQLDIEQYNGLNKKPTIQKHLSHLPNQPENTIKPSTSALIQEEVKPSIFTLFDLPSSEKERIKTPSPITPKKQSDSTRSIIDQIEWLTINNPMTLTTSMTDTTQALTTAPNPATIGFTGVNRGANQPHTWSFGRTIPLLPSIPQIPPFRGGGGGRGGGRGGGGFPQNPNIIIQAPGGGGGKVSGALPAIFTGDCTKAEVFMEAVRSYLHLNAQTVPMNTYQGKVAFTLTLIQGDLVKDFVRTQGDILDQSIEEPDTWFNFLRAFDARFLDTQKDARARTKIETLKLKDYNVDKYVQHFIALAREANYDLHEISVLMKFLKGLPYRIAEECLHPLRPADFAGLVQRAQDTVSLYANMKQLQYNCS